MRHLRHLLLCFSFHYHHQLVKGQLQQKSGACRLCLPFLSFPRYFTMNGKYFTLQWNHSDCRSSRSQMSFKIAALKNFANSTGNHLCWAFRWDLWHLALRSPFTKIFAVKKVALCGTIRLVKKWLNIKNSSF